MKFFPGKNQKHTHPEQCRADSLPHQKKSEEKNLQEIRSRKDRKDTRLSTYHDTKKQPTLFKRTKVLCGGRRGRRRGQIRGVFHCKHRKRGKSIRCPNLTLCLQPVKNDAFFVP